MFSVFNWIHNKKVNRERILAFDLIRGLFLMEIVTTHIIWQPSLFTFVGGRGQLFASAAEGFFTISGVLVGYLYGPKVLKETKKVFKKIWKRAFLLYFLATFFTFFYTAWAALEPNSIVNQTLYAREPWRFLVDTFTMRYAFGWAFFLNRYAMFMLVAPFVVWLIAKRKAWIVALVSFLIWFFLRDVERLLPFSSWQVLFMYSIILGFYLPHIEDWFRSLARKWRTLLATVVISFTAITYVFSMFVFVIAPLVYPPDSSVMQLYVQLLPYFDKSTLEPARIAVGIVWFAAIYIVFRRYEKQISKGTHGVLEVFGKQSLFVYSFHAFVLFIIDLYFRPPVSDMLIANTIVTALVLAIIYYAAYYRGHVTKYGKQLLRNRDTTTIP